MPSFLRVLVTAGALTASACGQPVVATMPVASVAAGSEGAPPPSPEPPPAPAPPPAKCTDYQAPAAACTPTFSTFEQLCPMGAVCPFTAEQLRWIVTGPFGGQVAPAFGGDDRVTLVGRDRTRLAFQAPSRSATADRFIEYDLSGAPTRELTGRATVQQLDDDAWIVFGVDKVQRIERSGEVSWTAPLPVRGTLDGWVIAADATGYFVAAPTSESADELGAVIASIDVTGKVRWQVVLPYVTVLPGSAVRHEDGVVLQSTLVPGRHTFGRHKVRAGQRQHVIITISGTGVIKAAVLVSETRLLRGTEMMINWLGAYDRDVDKLPIGKTVAIKQTIELTDHTGKRKTTLTAAFDYTTQPPRGRWAVGMHMLHPGVAGGVIVTGNYRDSITISGKTVTAKFGNFIASFSNRGTLRWLANRNELTPAQAAEFAGHGPVTWTNAELPGVALPGMVRLDFGAR